MVLTPHEIEYSIQFFFPNQFVAFHSKYVPSVQIVQHNLLRILDSYTIHIILQLWFPLRKEEFQTTSYGTLTRGRRYRIFPHIVVIGSSVALQGRHRDSFLKFTHYIPGSNNFCVAGDLQQKKFLIFTTPSFRKKLFGFTFLWMIFSWCNVLNPL